MKNKHLNMTEDPAALIPYTEDNVHIAVINFCGVGIPGVL